MLINQFTATHAILSSVICSRFGHQLVRLAENKVLLTCGFGCSQNKHQRLRDGVIVDFVGGMFSNIRTSLT